MADGARERVEKFVEAWRRAINRGARTDEANGYPERLLFADPLALITTSAPVPDAGGGMICQHRNPGAIVPCLLPLGHDGDHDDDEAKGALVSAMRRLQNADGFGGLHFGDCPALDGASACDCTASEDVPVVLDALIAHYPKRPAAPPVPAGVDREALAEACIQVAERRVSKHDAALIILDLFTGPLSWLAPLLGVTGGASDG